MAIQKTITWHGIELFNSYHMIHHYTTNKAGTTHATVYVYASPSARQSNIENFIETYDVDLEGSWLTIDEVYEKVMDKVGGEKV